MDHTSLAICCALLTVVLVGVAMITDLRWRRIPNFLTFPALGLALVVRIGFQGWAGLGVALGGAVLAPGLLLLMHGGRGLGMGDLKLAAGIGAIVGPLVAVATMLLSAIAGGLLAIACMLRPGTQVAQTVSVFLISLPFVKKQRKENSPPVAIRTEATTMPYGVALGVGTLAALLLCWWTGYLTWFLSFVEIAANL
jgi:prepilin peptidase CpaA